MTRAFTLSVRRESSSPIASRPLVQGRWQSTVLLVPPEARTSHVVRGALLRGRTPLSGPPASVVARLFGFDHLLRLHIDV